ncbi:MAG: hypothetical protein JRJ85_10700 [Deltaproteobacteria bacterium]|nr:hypothetical protein [Deltaproteobacteria bacterium]
MAFRTNTRLGRDVSLMTLGEELYQYILLATGPGSQATDPIATDDNGYPIVDPVTLETSEKGVFAGGGLLPDRAPLVKVVGSAKRSAMFMARRLQHLDLSMPSKAKPKPVKNLPGHGMEAIPRREIPTDQTAHLSDVASAESRRCMTCGARAFIAHPEDCMTCFNCEMACPSGAVRVHPFKEVISCPIEYPAGGENHG